MISEFAKLLQCQNYIFVWLAMKDALPETEIMTFVPSRGKEREVLCWVM